MKDLDSIIDCPDIIDTSDLQERIDDLESELSDAEEGVEEAESIADKEQAREILQQWRDDYGEELQKLQKFAEEISGYCPDYNHGETLIKEDHFEDYARELAEEISDSAMRNAGWPYNCNDWEKAADELKGDYTSAELDGTTYYFRS